MKVISTAKVNMELRVKLFFILITGGIVRYNEAGDSELERLIREIEKIEETLEEKRAPLTEGELPIEGNQGLVLEEREPSLIEEMLAEEEPPVNERDEYHYIGTRSVTESEKREILSVHNHLRASEPAADMVRLQWHDEAAKEAQSLADRVAQEGCTRPRHELPHVTGYKLAHGCGQNIAMQLKSQRPNWESVIQSWHSEKQYFRYGMPPRDNKVVGHYTQVVWARTAFVGCGVADCPNNFRFWVCDYCPGGNGPPGKEYIPFTVGRKCSKCEAGCGLDNLCKPPCQVFDVWGNCQQQIDKLNKMGRDGNQIICSRFGKTNCKKTCGAC